MTSGKMEIILLHFVCAFYSQHSKSTV